MDILAQPADSRQAKPGQQEPATQKHPLTYQLRDGGVLFETCPSWCILDHADETQKLMYAEDLVHEGAEIELPITTIEGDRQTILAARIQQWPFSTDANGSEVPYMAYRANAGYGEALGYSTPDDVEAEIRRTEAHLQKLRRLNARLVQARAEDQQRQGLRPENLAAGDVQTLPVPVLLKAFGLKVFEVGDMPGNTLVWLDRGGDQPGFHLDRTLTQADREAVIRQCLAEVVEATARKARP